MAAKMRKRESDEPERTQRRLSLVEWMLLGSVLLGTGMVAIPHFQICCVRSRVAQARADMNVIGQKLVRYSGSEDLLPKDRLEDPFGSLAVLTTPVAFFWELPKDPFRHKRDLNFGSTYFYGRRSGDYQDILYAAWSDMHGRQSPTYQFMLASYGPDLLFAHAGAVDMEQYDPTNGTVSRGNIWYVGP